MLALYSFIYMSAYLKHPNRVIYGVAEAKIVLPVYKPRNKIASIL